MEMESAFSEAAYSLVGGDDGAASDGLTAGEWWGSIG